MCEKEINVFRWPGKNPDLYKIKLERGQKGYYAWEITVAGEDPASVKEKIDAIDCELRKTYPGQTEG